MIPIYYYLFLIFFLEEYYYIDIYCFLINGSKINFPRRVGMVPSTSNLQPLGAGLQLRRDSG